MAAAGAVELPLSGPAHSVLLPQAPSVAGARHIKLEGSRGSTPEASTPASLQSTPSGIRSPASDYASPRSGSPSPPRRTLQLVADRLATLRGSDAPQAAPGSRGPAVAPIPAPAAPPAAAAAAGAATRGDLMALQDHAQLVGADADILRDGLRAARRQLVALQQQLLGMQRQAVRQQQVLGSVVLEKDCEVKLARSEAEAYRTAARARNAAVSTLQRWVGVGMRLCGGWFGMHACACLCANTQWLAASSLCFRSVQCGGGAAAGPQPPGGPGPPAVCQPGRRQRAGVTHAGA